METAEAGEVLWKAPDWDCETLIVEVKSCYEYKPNYYLSRSLAVVHYWERYLARNWKCAWNIHPLRLHIFWEHKTARVLCWLTLLCHFSSQACSSQISFLYMSNILCNEAQDSFFSFQPSVSETLKRKSVRNSQLHTLLNLDFFFFWQNYEKTSPRRMPMFHFYYPSGNQTYLKWFGKVEKEIRLKKNWAP